MLLNKIMMLGILSLSLNASFALKTDNDKPVQITANSATANQKEKTTQFTGNVIMTRGSILVKANTANASQDANGNNTIILVGTPITFEQMNDDGEKTEAQCNNFEYNTKTNLAVLTGRARVKKGDNVVMGDKLTYNTQTQVYSATSNNANGVNTAKSGRVTVILQPNQKGQDKNAGSL